MRVCFSAKINNLLIRHNNLAKISQSIILLTKCHPAPHKMNEKKYHQVSPTLQCSDYQIFMCDTCLKKSLTKYHQVSPSITNFFGSDSLRIDLYLASIYKLYNQHASAIYFAGEQFSSLPGCTQFVHPHVHGL